MRHFFVILLLLTLTSCSLIYARWSYEFVPLTGNSQILYEPGAEDLVKLVSTHLAASIKTIEKQQYAPFKEITAIKIYVFNDRNRYANFSQASTLTRGSATTHEVYLSEKLRERINTLPNILLHELSHVHIRQYAGTFKYVADLPGWFLEGLAVAVSSGGGAENVTSEQARAALRKGLRFEPDDSGKLFGAKSAHHYGLEPHMYYRQASIFVEYLRESNPQGFKAAIRDLLHGMRFRDVWKKHYGHNIGDLWRGFYISAISSQEERTMASSRK